MRYKLKLKHFLKQFMIIAFILYELHHSQPHRHFKENKKNHNKTLQLTLKCLKLQMTEFQLEIFKYFRYSESWGQQDMKIMALTVTMEKRHASNMQCSIYILEKLLNLSNQSFRSKLSVSFLPFKSVAAMLDLYFSCNQQRWLESSQRNRACDLWVLDSDPSPQRSTRKAGLPHHPYHSSEDWSQKQPLSFQVITVPGDLIISEEESKLWQHYS